MKTVIIDDELTQLRGLVTSIDWELHGIEIAGQARNGREGLELIRRVNPGLVITDIRMPLMDGLEMISTLAREKEKLRFIVLSGYDDFAYAQQAIHLGVREYLLKPVDADELLRLAVRIKGEVETANAEKTQAFINERIFQKESLSIRSRFLSRLFCGEFLESGEAQRYSSQIGVPLQGPEFVAVIVSLDDIAQIRKSLSQTDWELLCFGVCNILQEIFSGNFQSAVGTGGTEFFILLGAESIGGVALAQACRSAGASIREYFPYTVSLACGSVCTGIGGLKASFAKAGELLRNKAYDGKDCVFMPCRAPLPKKEGEAGGQPATPHNDGLEGRLTAALKSRDTEKARALCDEMFSGFFASRFAFEKVQSRAAALLAYLHGTFPGAGLTRDPWLQVQQFENIGDLQAWFLGSLNRLAEELGICAAKDRWVLEKTSAYVEAHFSEEITVPILAEKLYLSPNYFSRVFKESAGTAFSEWLNQYRVEKAKELLRTTPCKVFEIAAMCGYSDYKYFNYVFRKLEGLSPSVYKKIQS